MKFSLTQRGPAWALLLTLCGAVAPASAQDPSAPAQDRWRPLGPSGASVESVVFTGKNDRDLLAITRNAFLYRTSDGGDSWTLVRFPAQYAALAHALTLHPADSGTFLVGVSSPNSSYAGLYRTRDNGVTWTHTLSGVAVFSAAYSPSDPKIVAAGARDGVHLSRDGGETWARISPLENKELQPVMSLGFDPRNPAILYAGTPHLPWKTSDGGASWTSIHQGMIDDSDILALIVNQSKPEQLFIGACSGIYRTDNSAARWTKLLGITGAGFRTYSVSLDPSQPETVYSGTKDGLWRSKDSGKSWQKLAPNVIKATAVAPHDSKIVFLATEDAGILRSRNGGASFEDASNGLTDRRMVRLSAPRDQLFVTLGLDSSTIRASVNDPAWKHVSLPRSSSLGFAAVGESAIYAFSSAGFWTSPNGATWTPLPALPASASAGAGVSQVPLAATSKTVYRFANNAWTPATSLGATAGPIRKLWTTRSGQGPAWIETASSVWISTDAGKTWTIGSLPVRGSDLYELEATSRVVWAATSRGLYRSLDQGKTWRMCDKGIDGASTTSAIAVRQESPSAAFAAQFGRIFETTDEGESWTELPVDSLQGSSITSLAIASLGTSNAQRNPQLVALTSARGVFVHGLNHSDGKQSSAAAQ
jgi:photosystem II stability/assembly factor-like uncharacterized protein